MNEIFIGSSLDSMIKKIKLPKKYNNNSILFIESCNDIFSYEINDDNLVIYKTNKIENDNLKYYNPVNIDIGISETPIKIISLNKSYSMSTRLIFNKHEYSDQFSYQFYNNQLVITRKDKNEGWKYYHSAKIYEGWISEYKGYIYENNNFNYNIGNNPNLNIKKINIDKYYPIGSSLYLQKNIYDDRFIYEFKNNELIIKRTDKNEGWLYTHFLNVIKTKIPKILLQTHYHEIPSYVKDKLKPFIDGWNYVFFDDRDIINFFKCNPLSDFPNIIEIFNNIKIGAHKADLFRYYYLYINGGVFLDSDAMIEKNLEDIIQDYDFITVVCNNPILYFNGFICTTPKNIIMYDAIKHIYNCNLSELSRDYFAIVQQFKKIVDKYKNNFKVKLFVEKGNYNGIMPTKDEENNDQVIFKHYYHTKVIPH